VTAVGDLLLERDVVLSALAGHLAAAAVGSGRMVLLRGEAGVGKTAVVRRFTERADERIRVLVGGCDPLSTPRPLSPVLDVVADLGPAVGQALEAAIAGTGSPTSVFRSMLSDLAESSRPTVLIAEDLHWADGATLDLLRYLARRIGALSVLVVGTYRDDEVGPRHPLTVALGDMATCAHTHRYRLEPLTQAAVAVLAAGSGHDVRTLHQMSGGNPFFVTEVLGSAAEHVPRTVREAVLGRLARASVGAQAAAETVAVIGPPAPLELVCSVHPGARAYLDEALAGGLLHADDQGLGFRHELARMAVFESIPGYRRQHLHARVVEALSPDPGSDPGRLAHHAEEAGDRDAVLRYAPPAAGQAMALGANREAAHQYGRALRHAGSLSDDKRAELLECQATAYFLTGLVADAFDSWQPAIEIRRRTGDRRREGDDRRWTSYMLWLLGRNADAREAGLRAVRLLEDADAGPELAKAYGNLAEQASYDSDVASTVGYARRAVEVGGRHSATGVVLRARFSAAIATVFAREEGWEELDRLWELASADPELVQHAGMFAPVISAVATVHRDFARADRFDEQAVSYLRDNDLDFFLDYLRGARSTGLLHRGEWDRAAAEADAVLRLCSLPPVSRIFPNVALGLVRARRGDPDSRPLLDEAAASGDPTDLIRLGPAFEAQIEAYWLQGDDAAAIAEARRALVLAHADTDPWAVGGLARWIVLAGGDPPDVIAAGPFALELRGQWQAAACAWEDRACPYDAALARLAGDVPALLCALETFDSLGARPAAAIAIARLRAKGVRPGTRGPRPSTRANPHGLTGRQVEILDLVAEGLTDTQIAARLHLSAKTVNHHVGAVLAKLGVHSRAEAVRRLAGG
jgi:DNA-binding CsgD family transcriptional regulator